MPNQAAKIKDALLKKCRGRAKEANLSRAAKGAIAAPIAALALGPIAAATHMPGVRETADYLSQPLSDY